jgi:GAF domain-containing protein
MVGAAIRLRQARIALDVGAEAVRFDNPLLPYTRSEIALPLMVGGEVLGALDAQSTQEAAFSEADIETLQAMANQVAIALQNARLFREMQQSLQELRALQRQYVRQGWSDLLRAGEIRWEAGEASPQAPSVVRIPLPLREEVVGEISLQGDLEWGDEEKEWLETLASQAALALESARLLEESARRAELERIATQIVQRTRSTLETQTILRTAARELQRLLRLPEVVLHFGPPPQRQK